MLLHGTKAHRVPVICANGLNERFSGGLFGHGTYLAEDVEKIDQYVAVDRGAAVALPEIRAADLGQCYYASPAPATHAVWTARTAGDTVYQADKEAEALQKLPRTRFQNILNFKCTTSNLKPC